MRGTRLGAFFLDSSGKVVTKQWFTSQVRVILESLGLPHMLYAGRIGAATSAARSWAGGRAQPSCTMSELLEAISRMLANQASPQDH